MASRTIEIVFPKNKLPNGKSKPQSWQFPRNCWQRTTLKKTMDLDDNTWATGIHKVLKAALVHPDYGAASSEAPPHLKFVHQVDWLMNIYWPLQASPKKPTRLEVEEVWIMRRKSRATKAAHNMGRAVPPELETALKCPNSFEKEEGLCRVCQSELLLAT